jgi:hypothetical protein
MAQRQAQILQIFIAEVRQQIEVDIVGHEGLSVLLQSNTPKPETQILGHYRRSYPQRRCSPTSRLTAIP